MSLALSETPKTDLSCRKPEDGKNKGVYIFNVNMLSFAIFQRKATGWSGPGFYHPHVPNLQC